MKKLVIVILTLSLVFLVSCTKNETPTPDKNDGDAEISEKIEEKTPETEENTPEPVSEQTDVELGQTEEHYTVKFSDGRQITLCSEAEEAIAALGDYLDYVEAPSCIHEGFDRVYSFRGFSVTTSPDADNVDRVTEVGIESEECVLDNGLTIGSTFDEMEAAFGDEFTDTFGFISYYVGNAQISLVSEDGIIRSILFSEAVE